MSDFERERQSVLRSTATQVEEARAETEALRRLIKLKTKELKNVRRLAQVCDCGPGPVSAPLGYLCVGACEALKIYIGKCPLVWVT